MLSTINFPVDAPRSARRRISRDQARRHARYGTLGQLAGPHAVYPCPARPRPASIRSGQARVNHKRNQRAAFLEHLIALPVSVELAEVCDVEPYLRMLPGRIIRREKDRYLLTWIYQVYAPGAPADAATMIPILYGHDDGTVTLEDIEWRRQDGSLIVPDSRQET